MIKFEQNHNGTGGFLMQVIEKGVLSDSYSFFHTPSQIAKKLFY